MSRIWLETLSPAQRERVLAIVNPRCYRFQNQLRRDGWWIRLDRSIGVPRKIELLRKNSGGQVVETIEVDATP